jgi:hypothetical protein
LTIAVGLDAWARGARRARQRRGLEQGQVARRVDHVELPSGTRVCEVHPTPSAPSCSPIRGAPASASDGLPIIGEHVLDEADHSLASLRFGRDGIAEVEELVWRSGVDGQLGPAAGGLQAGGHEQRVVEQRIEGARAKQGGRQAGEVAVEGETSASRCRSRGAYCSAKNARSGVLITIRLSPQPRTLGVI